LISFLINRELFKNKNFVEFKLRKSYLNGFKSSLSIKTKVSYFCSDKNDKSMKTYIPIACGMYDELEALATTGAAVVIQFFIDGSIAEETGRIVNLFTREKTEFLQLANGVEIRLDELFSVNGKSFSASCKQENAE